MRYDGIYSCGHEGSVYIYGKSDYREWRKEKIFSGICPDCYKKQLAKERTVAKEAAMEEAKEMQLPELFGTEKQVAWAVTLRSECINKVSAFFKENAGKKIRIETDGKKIYAVDELASAFDSLLETQTSAKFWIENRSDFCLQEALLSYYKKTRKRKLFLMMLKKNSQLSLLTEKKMAL